MVRVPCSRTRSISAWARVDLPLPDRPVKKRTSPCSSVPGWSASMMASMSSVYAASSVTGKASTSASPAYVRATWAPRAWSMVASPRLASGTATTLRPRACCGSECGPDEGSGRQIGGAGADEGQQEHRAGDGQLLELLLGECVDDRNDRPATVLLAHLRGAEVVAAERAVLRVCQRLHRTTGDGDAGQGQALGVDQLDATGARGGPVDSVWERQRDRTARLVEGCYRAQSAGRQQLEVVELAGGRAVLRVTHRSILTDSVEFQRHRDRRLRCEA